MTPYTRHQSSLVSTHPFRLLSTHADKQGVGMSVFVVFLCVSVFVRLRISPPRIKIAASNFARWFIGILGRESPILGNFAPQKPKIGRIGPPPGSGAAAEGWRLRCTSLPTANVTLQMRSSWNIVRRVDVGRHELILGHSPLTYLFANYDYSRPIIPKRSAQSISSWCLEN